MNVVSFFYDEVVQTTRKKMYFVVEHFGIDFGGIGHPGTRNDKHIVRTDYSVVDLLQDNGWIQSKAWKMRGPNGSQVLFFEVNLICDGRYLRWPCLILPVKIGPAGSPVMKWSAKVEWVRKDIEGVFGILKQRFKFLKNFSNEFVACGLFEGC
jgi:Plant transposon protein